MTAPKAGSRRSGEFELIQRYFAPLTGKGAFGLMDDAALVLPKPGKALVVTQDAIAAGVHFFADDPAETIAAKALRVNLSDLAAKGARPVGFSLALGLPPDWREPWLAAFAKGLAADCRRYDIELTGGDTFLAPSGPVISICAFGEIESRRYRSRLGAKPGDRLFVTGTIGDAALGLRVRRGEPQYAALAGANALLRKYLLPDPPVAFAPLIGQFASASLDISDGLVGDLEKLARASGVDFAVECARLPMSAPVRRALAIDGALEAALTGGDDYQFLFTVPARKCPAFAAALARAGLSATELAVARRGRREVKILDGRGRPMRFERTAHAHF
jgi:thiamine-monophosphate kinase